MTSSQNTLRETIDDFLAQKRIAVAGVSRSNDQAANLIYRKLRDAGYRVFAVNPNAEEVEGDSAWPDLASLPEKPDGVVAATAPAATVEVVRQAIGQGIPRVWMHRSFGEGSVSKEAVELCREHGIAVIPGACPMMYCQPVDVGHKCIRFLLKLTGGLPRAHETASAA